MKVFPVCTWFVLSILAAAGVAIGEDPAVPSVSQCVKCHGNKDRFSDDQSHLFVGPTHLANDIHWQKGLDCRDCHGGDANTSEKDAAHAIAKGFRKIATAADVPGFCGHCHADIDNKRTVNAAGPRTSMDSFWQDVHSRPLQDTGAQSGKSVTNEDDVERDAKAAVLKTPNDQDPPPVVTCISCHAVHQTRRIDDPQSRVHASRQMDTCGKCHAPQRDALISDVHGKPTDESDPLTCSTCHGAAGHGLTSVKDRASPVFVNHQVEMCGECHKDEEAAYRESVHGHGLELSGLLVTAVCADCHGAHGVFPADDKRSNLFVTNVAGTCATCHRFIEERLNHSVHGRGDGPGSRADRAAPGGDQNRTPTCTDCHPGHDKDHPDMAGFRRAMASRCGNCHQELFHEFAISIHGQLTALGFAPAAKCADCHGDHEIAPLDDAASLLSPANRAATCGKCHPHASGNFLDFDPHANHTVRSRSPVLHTIYMVLLSFIVGTFSFFGLHSIMWFVRGLIEVKKHGRKHSWTPGAVAYVRFSIFHRAAHAALLVSFLGLALTGLPLKYSGSAWAFQVANMLGGFPSTSAWHRIFGLVNVACLAIYLVRMFLVLVRGQRAGTPVLKIVFGPDSPVPNWRDARDFIAMVRWFFGRGPKPTFERWAYWEKFDFWGASADIVIIGVTGLVLWFPYLFCAFLPGEVLNVAKVIHSTQALLATGFVFAIHFFATHLRPEKFPMDMVMLTGMVSEDELEEERPDMLARLEQEGRLEAMRTTIPNKGRLLSLALGGAIGLLIGLALLLGILVGIFGG